MNSINFLPRIKFFLKVLFCRNEIEKIKLKKNSPEFGKNQQKGKVIIYAERYWPIHACWELSIGKILQEDGYEIIVVACDGANNFCDSYAYGNVPGKHCGDCSYSIKQITGKFGFSFLSISKYLDEKSINYNKFSRVFRIIESELENIVGCSFLRHLRSNKVSNSDLKIKGHLISSASKTNLFWDIFLSENDCKFCFFLNGLFFNSAVLKRHCEIRGIDYYTYERGNRRNTLIFSRNSIAVPIKMEETWNRFKEVDLDYSQIEATRNYLSRRVDLGNGHISFFPKKKNFFLNKEKASDLNKVSYKRVYAMFTNIIWDSAVYQQDTIFENMYDWIEKTVGFFIERTDLRLIIRVHPAEIRIEWWKTRYGVVDFIRDRFKSLPDNITIIGPDDADDSYQIMEYANIGLFYTSTSGLEFGLNNKPVIVCGNSHYAFMNFVYKPTSFEEYYTFLSSELSVDESQYDEIIKYCYLFYFLRTIDIPFVSETKKFELLLSDFSEVNGNLKKQILDIFK